MQPEAEALIDAPGRLVGLLDVEHDGLYFSAKQFLDNRGGDGPT
jgi:hypothetical protein